jgi:hypothetical protein
MNNFDVFDKVPKSRYSTFKFSFDRFRETGGKVVVELGTTRSFVHGGHKGCNTNDTAHWHPDAPEDWDWGAGFFTRVCAEDLHDLSPEIHTVDLAHDHIQRCRVITSEFPIHYHIQDSESFLKGFPKKIDLLYLDTGDMTPIEPTAQLQLREARIIVESGVIPIGGTLLIDDVRDTTPFKFGDKSGMGKSKYSIPYLKENGFEVVMDEYQVVMRRQV